MDAIIMPGNMTPWQETSMDETLSIDFATDAFLNRFMENR
jgi:hypothetical protein